MVTIPMNISVVYGIGKSQRLGGQAVLRALDSTPELSSEMPLWGSSATKRTWQADLGRDPVGWKAKGHGANMKMALW